MQIKRQLIKGVILIEVVLCLSVNLLFLLGGLEMGWYLHVRQSLAGAAGNAVFMTQNANTAEDAAMVYLTGMNLPEDLIDSVTVTADSVTINGSSSDRVTVSLPLSEVLMFGGIISNLANVSDTNITAVAYNRESSNGNGNGNGNGN